MSRKSEAYLNYHVYGEPDAAIRMDYFFWVARNERRTVVVDCGFAPTVGSRRGREVLCAPVDAFRALGIEPSDVPQVVVTHGHYDHIGNIDEFENSELFIARRELELWTGPYGRRRQFAAPTETDEIEQLSAALRDGRVAQVEGERVVAPGIAAVVVGGHTPGQLIVLVDTEGGQAVLTSDAVHFYEEHELDRPFSLAADVEDMYRAFDLLSEITSGGGRTMVVGHDPDVMRRFPAYAPAAHGPLDGLVARVG